MSNFAILAAQNTEMPQAPYQARHFIDGVYIDSADLRTSAQPWERKQRSNPPRAAFDDGRWSRFAAKDRAAVLNKVADLIEQNVERLAVIETLESGKPLSQARGEFGGAAELWRYAASLACTSHGDSHNALGANILGVVIK